VRVASVLAALALTPAASGHTAGEYVASDAAPQAVSMAAARPGTPGTTLDAFHAALAAGRIGQAAALLDAGLLVYEGGHAERSKAEYAGHHLGADAAFAKGTSVKVLQHSEHIEGTLAVITRETETTGSHKGAPVHSFGTETAILKREGEAWLIVHLHWSARKAK
jgi:ketosteroid isomerase-like protein